MKFIYLMQTEGETPETFRGIEARAKNGEIDFIKLTFKTEHPDALYLPNSTWTEGRNHLLKAARARKVRYDYYIFCDDDLEIVSGSWEAFEDHLREYRPALATPFNKRAAAPDTTSILQVYDIDAMANAVHRDLIDDEVLYPYYAGFDSHSWWLSQLFVIHMAGVLYPGHVVRSNRLAVVNGLHRAYPRLDTSPPSWAPYEQFLLREAFGNHPIAHERFRHHYAVLGEDFGVPAQAPETYRLPDAARSMLNMSGAFFANRAAGPDIARQDAVGQA